MSIPLFRQDESYRELISEVSALSGYPQNVCREVFEFLLIDWAVKIADNPGEYADLEIPYLGSVSVKYNGDEVLPNGKLKTNVDTYVTLKDSFRTLIGDLYDEGKTDLIPLLQKKIENAVLVASSPTV